MNSSIILPVTLWNGTQTTFRISAICVTPNFEKLVTGSYSGQLCIWDVNILKNSINPKTLIIGHEHSVTSMVSTNEYVISCCEGGKMYKWNLEDGYCDKASNSVDIHRHLQLCTQMNSSDDLLLTCGDYPNILIYHPMTLQIIFYLYSSVDSDWIENFHTFQNIENTMVLGITMKGCLKFWAIGNDIKEAQHVIRMEKLNIEKVVDLKFSKSANLILIVTIKYWCLYHFEYLNCICRVESINDEILLGGNFCDKNVVVWSNSGKFYFYRETDCEQHLVMTLLDNSFYESLFNPAMIVKENDINSYYFLKGDSFGQVSIWTLSTLLESLEESRHIGIKPVVSAVLNDKWIKTEKAFFDNIIGFSTVTCSCYIMELDKFFLGCLNGCILCIPAIQSIKSFYFHSPTEKSPYDLFLGHNDKINCLLHPYSKYSYHDKSHLVSGSSDFSVCLWDIFKVELLHKFCVQAGEILELNVPPPNCRSNVKNSVYSVSSDHSVAVLNLTDRRCIILTSRHMFPVVTINWKPLHDFLIIECFDGTVYVWETETGLLDRVLNGVAAQEVVYACNEENYCQPSTSNFYINEQSSRKNSLQRELFQVQGNIDFNKCPVVTNSFFTNNKYESQIFLCSFEYLVARLTSYPQTIIQDKGSSLAKLNFLTVPAKSEFPEKSEKSDNCLKDDANSQGACNLGFSEVAKNILHFFLSCLHIWEVDPVLDEFLLSCLGLLKPNKPLSLGIVSHPGLYSLLLPNDQNHSQLNSSIITSICIIMMAVSKMFQSGSVSWNSDIALAERQKNSWEHWYSFYERFCLNFNKEFFVPRPKIEIFAKMWQSNCLPVRNIVRKFLPTYLEKLSGCEQIDLLKFWYKYLPHFKLLDHENVDMKTIALVLFGLIGSDLKFKSNYSSCQENYVYQTCASFVYLFLLPDKEKSRLNTLQTIAVDFIGRGYIVWEQFLPVEKVFSFLFQMCSNTSAVSRSAEDFFIQAPLDKCLTALGAIKAIAVARTSAFIKCLLKEINQTKLLTPIRNDNYSLENSKSEILSVVLFLLEETPYIMLLYLSEIVSVLIYCIDASHLKQKNLTKLLPIMRKFRQVHHSVAGQRIAVGSASGFIVVHDLKTGKNVSVSAHKDSVSTVKFSDDGRHLASYSCYENRLSFWHILTGIFGLGHIHVKNAKTYRTNQIHDEEIRNHLEIAKLSWSDGKSVVLTLCDGSETTFHN